MRMLSKPAELKSGVGSGSGVGGGDPSGVGGGDPSGERIGGPYEECSNSARSLSNDMMVIRSVWRAVNGYTRE